MENSLRERAAVDHGTAGVSFGRRFRGLIAAVVIAGFSFSLAAQQGPERSEEDYLDRLEWRGILVLPGETQFSFHDQPGEKGFWIRLGQVRNGIEVVHYDARENQVTVRRGAATRTLSLSDSSVKALEGEVAAAPPPLVLVNKSANEAEEDGQEAPQVDPGAEGLWTEALEGSAQLREIDQQFRNINAEQAKLAEALAAVEPGDPAYAELETRQKEIQEERRILTEGAVTELRNGSSVSGDAGKTLEESLRGGLSRQLHMPEQPSNQAPPDPGETAPDRTRDSNGN